MLRQARLDLELPERKRKLIDELGYGTHAKLMLGFTEAIWRTRHLSNGSTLSDLGIQNTWDASIGQEGNSAILTQFAGGSHGMQMGDSTPEYQAWLAMDPIGKIFPGARQAYTSTAVRMHWPTAPLFRGSYACYLPGQWATHGEEGKRVGNLHFAGEHTSLDYQGFMEGAAETGGLVAAEILRDLGQTLSAAGQAALGPKLALPQSTYRAEAMTGLRWIERRRVIAELARRQRRAVGS
jgi:monoamine oxidase